MRKTKDDAVLLLLLEIVCAGGTFGGKHVYWMTSKMPFCCSGVVSVVTVLLLSIVVWYCIVVFNEDCVLRCRCYCWYCVWICWCLLSSIDADSNVDVVVIIDDDDDDDDSAVPKMSNQEVFFLQWKVFFLQMVRRNVHKLVCKKKTFEVSDFMWRGLLFA